MGSPLTRHRGAWDQGPTHIYGQLSLHIMSWWLELNTVYVMTEAFRPLVAASSLAPGPAWEQGLQVEMGLRAGPALELLFQESGKVNN